VSVHVHVHVSVSVYLCLSLSLYLPVSVCACLSCSSALLITLTIPVCACVPRASPVSALRVAQVGIHGPAIRDKDGNKLIINGFGGSGLWNPQPNVSTDASVAGGAGRYTSPRSGSGEVCDPYAVHTDALMPGDVLSSKSVGNGSGAVDTCCGLCAAERACVAWTVNWKEGMCYLQDSPCVARHTCTISNGQNTVGIALNPPSQDCTSFSSTCDWLFNVVADAREQHPLNASSDPSARATQVALNDTLQQLWATRVPQASPEQPGQCRPTSPPGGNCSCPHPIGPCVDKQKRTFVCPYCEPDAPLHPTPFDVDPAAES
jgi:hypothetical protein